MKVPAETIKQYHDFFENLTDARAEGFRELAAPDVRYRDPLIDLHGADAVVEAMHGWFRDMQDIKFRITHHATDEQVLLQHWIMEFRIRKMPKRLWEIEGTSKVTFDERGKILEQVDYWDPLPLFESVPVLGRAVKLIKRLFG